MEEEKEKIINSPAIKYADGIITLQALRSDTKGWDGKNLGKELDESYTRLINFVLDLVEKEVNKLETNGSETFADGHMQCKSEVSTIINNLRV